MARMRVIKPGFFENEVLGELSIEARYLFIALWTLADRDGNLEDRPLRIRAYVFPYNQDMTANTVQELIQALVDRGFLMRYEANGDKYVHIVKFAKHQRPHKTERKSGIPGPDRCDNGECSLENG